MERSKGKRLMLPCMSRIDPRRWVSLVMYRATSSNFTLPDRYATEAHVPISHFCNMTACAKILEYLLSSSVTGSAFRKATTLLTVEPIMSLIPMTASGEIFLHSKHISQTHLSVIPGVILGVLSCSLRFIFCQTLKRVDEVFMNALVKCLSRGDDLADLLEESSMLISD